MGIIRLPGYLEQNEGSGIEPQHGFQKHLQYYGFQKHVEPGNCCIDVSLVGLRTDAEMKALHDAFPGVVTDAAGREPLTRVGAYGVYDVYPTVEDAVSSVYCGPDSVVFRLEGKDKEKAIAHVSVLDDNFRASLAKTAGPVSFNFDRELAEPTEKPETHEVPNKNNRKHTRFNDEKGPDDAPDETHDF